MSKSDLFSCDAPAELAEYTVPSMNWAVFSCTLETIGKTEDMAISKGLSKSGYKPLNMGYITGRMKSWAADITLTKLIKLVTI